MGYTHFTVERIEFILAQHEVKNVLDLGAQNMYNQPLLPAPYAREWYNDKGIEYTSIDINSEHGAIPIDLNYPIDHEKNLFISEGIEFDSWRNTGYDFLVDAGVTEHLEIDGKFNWKGIYNAWLTKLYLLKNGGIMYNENPKTGNWPKHGFNYYTQEFYHNLCAVSDLEILGLGEHAACNNYVDGWNVWCILKKCGNRFPTLEEFSLLGIKES